MKRDSWRSLRRMVWLLLRVAVMVPLVFMGVLYLVQDRLIFPGAPLAEARRSELRERFGDREIEVETADGQRLHGWFVPAESPAPAPLLIYFGGNAEEVSGLLDHHSRLSDWSLMLLNYRGFGLSEGLPSEEALLADALRIYDHAVEQPLVDPGRVVVWGRSLGTGVAVHLAASRPVAGVILTTPYDSVTALAQRRYPLVPVGWLLRHPFDSLSRAADLETPLLALLAAEDRVIPPSHGERLFHHWRGPKQLEVLPETGHNSIQRTARYWALVEGFLRARGGCVSCAATGQRRG